MVIVDQNPLRIFKVLYGTGAVRLNDKTGKPERVGGIESTESRTASSTTRTNCWPTWPRWSRSRSASAQPGRRSRNSRQTTRRLVRFRFVSAFALATIAATAGLGADGRPIDAQRSTLTVRVFKSGLFSAFADNHVVRAPIATGSISLDGTLAVEIGVQSAGLTVLDPDASAATRAEVQAKMLGPEVLDSARYPDIRFASTEVAVVSADRWTVTGLLTLPDGFRHPADSDHGRNGERPGRGEGRVRHRSCQPRRCRIVNSCEMDRDVAAVAFEADYRQAPRLSRAAS